MGFDRFNAWIDCLGAVYSSNNIFGAEKIINFRNTLWKNKKPVMFERLILGSNSSFEVILVVCISYLLCGVLISDFEKEK